MRKLNNYYLMIILLFIKEIKGKVFVYISVTSSYKNQIYVYSKYSLTYNYIL